MKKIFFVLFAFIATVSYAQSGYKDFTFGMTIEQVKQKAPDLAVDTLIRWAAPINSYMFLYYNEIVSTIHNPLSQTQEKITQYKSNNSDLTFLFANEKLVAVELFFMGEDVFSSLKKQYGNVSPVPGQYGNYKFRTATWNKDPNRLIIWESETSGYGIETVTYIDGKWLTPLINKTVNVLRSEKSTTRSRLD